MKYQERLAQKPFSAQVRTDGAYSTPLPPSGQPSLVTIAPPKSFCLTDKFSMVIRCYAKFHKSLTMETFQDCWIKNFYKPMPSRCPNDNVKALNDSQLYMHHHKYITDKQCIYNRFLFFFLRTVRKVTADSVVSPRHLPRASSAARLWSSIAVTLTLPLTSWQPAFHRPL